MAGIAIEVDARGPHVAEREANYRHVLLAVGHEPVVAPDQLDFVGRGRLAVAGVDVHDLGFSVVEHR